MTHSKKIKLEKDCFEKKAWNLGHYLVGVDEVGRGCLAGPVLSAAVILPHHAAHPLLKDSKKMTEKQRNSAYEWISNNSIIGIGLCDEKTIDALNIYKATQVSMIKALHNLFYQLTTQTIDSIVIDAMPLSFCNPSRPPVEVHSFIKGESYSCSIAAASIVAKVTRDALMNHFETLFPGYGLSKHKGYATAVHQQAVRTLGVSPIHRLTFLKNIIKQVEDHGTKQTIF